jgi:predicted lipoprotein with Yx(FWY)xxD motif/cytochrome c5
MGVVVPKRYLVTLLALGVGLLFQARADDSRDPDILVAQNPAFGQYVTDFKGRSLYVFARDSKQLSNCYDDCAVNWPPLLFSDKASPVAGNSLDEKLIGFIKRKDGKAQITYSGWPLYNYAKDIDKNQFTGQGLGGNWFLISPKGETIKVVAQGATQVQLTQTQQAQQAQNTQPTAAQTAAINQAKKDGEPLYKTYCLACHGEAGVGGAGPKFAGSPPILKDVKGVISQTLGGGQQMPGFGPALNDKQAAALITYIRNSWGNSYGLTTEEEVKARR